MKVSETYNLLTCYPKVAKSIDFDATMKEWEQNPKKYAHITCLEDCSKITPASSKRAIFKCLKNPKHDNWDAIINSRTSLGCGCPQCAGQVASKDNNLLICYPEIAKSIDFGETIKAWEKEPKKYIHSTCLEDCNKITPKTNKRAIFKCLLKYPEHDNWDTIISNRTNKGNGCPQCGLIQQYKSYTRARLKNNNNLLACYPEIAKSIDFNATTKVWRNNPKKYVHVTCLEDCSKITPKCNKRAIFKCLNNYEHNNWDAIISKRTGGMRGCPQCSGRVASKGNNLLECYPEVAESIDFKATLESWEQNPKKYAHITCLEDCEKITPSSGKRAIFKCLKNLEHDNWDAIIKNRTSLSRGCPQCAGQVASKENNLLTCYPDVAKSIDFNATMKAWKCNPKKYIHITCLEDCSKITPSGSKRAIFKCLKNPEHNNWNARISNRIKGSGCPQCGLMQQRESYLKTRLKNNNNLLDNYPEVVKYIDFDATMKAWEKEPKKYAHITCLEDCFKIVPGTHKHAIFKCLKNSKHERWDTSIYIRIKHGCPQCAAGNVSREEKTFKNELVKILHLRDYEYKTNVRLIPNFKKNVKQKLELDFVCEKLAIAVEFNGAYWHSDKNIKKTKGVSADFYHRYKFEQAKKLGLTLLFVQEQDWMDNKKAVLTAIQNYCFKHAEIPEILQLQA